LRAAEAAMNMFSATFAAFRRVSGVERVSCAVDTTLGRLRESSVAICTLTVVPVSARRRAGRQRRERACTSRHSWPGEGPGGATTGGVVVSNAASKHESRGRRIRCS
jgi:hypothetical protein